MIPGTRGMAWWHRQPIERKLPVAFTALLILVALFYTLALYREVQRSTAQAVTMRLKQVGEEVAQLASTNNDQRIRNVRHLADSLGIAPTMVRLSSADSSSVILLDRSARAMAQEGPPPSPAASAILAAETGIAIERSSTGYIGKLFRDGPKVHYWTYFLSSDSAGSKVIAQLRQLRGNDRSSKALQSLIGESGVLIANTDDYQGPWVRLEGAPVTAPDSATRTRTTHVRDGTHYLVRATPIKGTAWSVITETPVAFTKQRATAFAVDTLPFSLALLFVGAVLAWGIGHRITRPIGSLANAAQAIGSGDYGVRVHVREGGDVGMMADAFNHMAAEVERSNAELDQRVKQRTAELEVVNSELYAFSYSVSHDLRSPLRSIDGFSQALLEDYSEQLDPTAQDYLRRVRGGAQRMGALIDDLLMLSRVSRQPIVTTDVNASAMAHEIIQELRQDGSGREVDVVVEEGLVMRADAGLLRVALQNLIGNAWKFTSQKAEARIEVGAMDCDGCSALYVRDNGAGFDMAHAHQLFAPFQRLHSSAEFSGTGIGLATVQRVVNRHGGKVWAEAERGVGATFYFTVDEGVNVERRDTAG